MFNKEHEPVIISVHEFPEPGEVIDPSDLVEAHQTFETMERLMCRDGCPLSAEYTWDPIDLTYRLEVFCEGVVLCGLKCNFRDNRNEVGARLWNTLTETSE